MKHITQQVRFIRVYILTCFGYFDCTELNYRLRQIAGFDVLLSCVLDYNKKNCECKIVAI